MKIAYSLMGRFRGHLVSAAWATVATSAPLIVWASSGQEHVEIESPFTLVMRAVNFLLLVGLLFYLLNKPFRNFLRRRQEGVKEALEAAQRARDEAEDRYQEAEKKLKQAKKEMQELKRMLVEQGEVEKQKILTNAKLEAEKIRHDTELAAAQELKKAHLLLRKEAVDLATNLAETILKDGIKENDHERLMQEYFDTLGKRGQ